VVVLVALAYLRGGEYDEYYSVFLIAGDPRPAWPLAPFLAGAAHSVYHGDASFGAIASALRHGDVHPPLYFWLLALWRDAVGIGLVRLRLLSVLCSLVTLVLVARIARRIGVAPALAVAITVLSYGFAYTGVVARNFAVTDALSLGGVVLLLVVAEAGGAVLGLLGGLLLGAACFANYLASFTTLAALGWMVAYQRRQPMRWAPPIIGAALFIPAGAWFFLAQAGSRPVQFRQFRLTRAMLDLARDQIGAVLGALPRYAAPPESIAIEAVLAMFAVWFAVVAIRVGLPRLAPPHRSLLVILILAPPIGLLILGALFDNTPIEMRYLWLGLPYVALLLAAALLDRPVTRTVLLAVQVAAIIGLALAPQTMQPAMRTARDAAHLAARDSIVLVPFGNDGVGIPGPFIAAAPPTMRLMVVRRATPDLLVTLAGYRQVIVADLMVDQASRGLVPSLQALFQTACWRLERSPAAITIFDNTCRGALRR
jgi:4-amino-4-deoxy-L-arabinose transferase-like glycosyltransferase